MLSGNYVLKMLPFCDNDLGELTEIDESEQVGFFTLKPSIFVRRFSSALSLLLDFRRELFLPIHPLLFRKSLSDKIANLILEAKENRI